MNNNYETDAKFSLLIIALLLIATAIAVVTYEEEQHNKPTIGDYFYAIAELESNHDPYAEHEGDEIGMYGITFNFWFDGVQFGRLMGIHEDCIDPAYSEAVMIAYYRRYANNAWLSQDWHTLARVHHGGWNGVNRPHTKQYADNVMNIIKQEVNKRYESIR